MSGTPILSFDAIEAARERIGDRVFRTPLSVATNLSRLTGTRLQMKLENLQISGSFKERGALNRLLLLSEEERRRGVVAASAGNHAQGLALHATRLGISAKIVMPERTPLLKVSRTRRYGGEVVLHGATYDDAWAHAAQLAEDEGRVIVHAFNDLGVMAGQGTIGLELLEQNPYLQTVIVPVGGGGLISGIAVAIKETNPKIRIIGVESEQYPSMKTAIQTGEIQTLPPRPSIADGIAVKRVGDLTFATARQYVDDIVTVTEEEIARAILLLLEEEKVVAEGAAAASLAALLGDQIPDIRDRRTAILVCGGNIDLNTISHIIERGLVEAGRWLRMNVVVPDVPGALARLTQVIGEEGANILQINHNRLFTRVTLGQVDIEVTLETRGREHVDRLTRRLQAEGYEVPS